MDLSKLKTLYGLDDITIVPAVLSDVASRSECNPYYDTKYLPLITAPMSNIVSIDNCLTFEANKINTIIPRNIPLEVRLAISDTHFVALGLDEFINLTNKDNYEYFTITRYICIDIANGHMSKLYDAVINAKSKYFDKLVLIIGNIANPAAYELYAKTNLVEYVRLAIGNGSVCITSSNSAVHYPMASLISECYDIKVKYNSTTKIIADGGFDSMDKIIKALALGADYVMLGLILAKSDAACGETHIRYEWDNPRALVYVDKYEYYGDREYIKERKYYGMSTRTAQEEFGVAKKRTAEGIEKWVSIDYTLSQWVDNFTHYLKNAMSYTNAKSLNEFIGKPEIKLITQNARKAYYK